MDDGTRFAAKDANELAGLSYRQLNDWEAKGAAPADRDAEGGWRRFTPRQIFALMVCNEIRRLYGTPLEKLRFVRRFMLQERSNHLAAAIGLMRHGLHVFLLTDLEKTFIMDSDLEFEDLLHCGQFRVEETRPYILLRLNEVVNRLLAATKKPIRLKPSNLVYAAHAKMESELRVQTVPEFDLLQAVRSAQFNRVEVTFRDGKIRRLNADGGVGAADARGENDGLSIKRRGKVETTVPTACDGPIVVPRQALPKEYTSEDNDPVLFAVRIGKTPPPSSPARDGEPPIGIAIVKTTTRRDRTSLSRESKAPKRARVPGAQPNPEPHVPARMPRNSSAGRQRLK